MNNDDGNSFFKTSLRVLMWASIKIYFWGISFTRINHTDTKYNSIDTEIDERKNKKKKIMWWFEAVAWKMLTQRVVYYTNIKCGLLTFSYGDVVIC